MARAKKAAAKDPVADARVEAGNAAERARAAGIEKLPFRVRIVPNKAARVLTTFGEAHDVWTREGRMMPELIAVDFKSHLIRLRPPPGTPSGWLDAVQDLLKVQAIGLRVVPPNTAPAVVLSTSPGATVPPPRMRPRDMVEQMVADAVGVDIEALRTLVGIVMDEEGL
jgi:hypothetical protein